MSAQKCTVSLKIQDAWRKLSVQECDAASKIQDAWRKWQRLHPFCTCTTSFYPDGDKMIPEKHVCLRCYEWIQGKKENAALKIQDAWRKYQESKDSCPICLMKIGVYSCKTKCGHLFCTECLLKSVQTKNSCPMCRGELIKTEEDDDMHEVHEMGMSMFDGDELDAAAYHQTENSSEYEDAVRDSFDASYSYQQGYAEGIEAGRQEAEEEFQPRMREEIGIAKQKAYDEGVVKGSSLADDVIRSLREEIDRLKRSNSRLREDLQFATQPTRELYIK